MAQQPRGSQEGPGKVGSEGGGEGDGELRPHGGSWERAGVIKGAEEEEEEEEGGDGGGGRQRSQSI